APDGRTMACGWYDDGLVRLCDLPSGKERHRLRVPSTDYDGFFSPDGKILVSFASPAELHLYDAETGKVIRVIKSGIKSRQPTTAVFSADGQTLALVNGSRGIDCWDVATGEKLRTLGNKEIFALAFSPDGKVLAALARTDGPHASVPIWSWPAGKEL